jgi:hypothetical protein
VAFFKLGFGIKEIDLAGTTVHEQKDARPGADGKVRRFDSEGRARFGGRGLAGKETVLCQQVAEGRAHEPAAALPEEFAARPATGR